MKEWIIKDDFLGEDIKLMASAQGCLHELIRCKDCKHSETDRNGIPYCTKFWRFMEYCSSGKRKEE